MKFKMTAFLLFLLISQKEILHAQISLNNVSVPSPNTSSLGQYGKNQVSYFNGSVLIQVPLFEADLNDLTVSLGLSYNTTGVMPDIHPGWVGSNWNLTTGGQITRIIRGFPDELNNNEFQAKGYYFTHNHLNNSNWALSDNISKKASSNYESIIRLYNNQANQNNDLSNFDIDLEPDEFIFNIPGLSGKFFLDETGVFKIKCNRYVKVIFNETDLSYPFLRNSGIVNNDPLMYSKTFSKFTIIDDKGTQFVFGSDESIEYTDEINGFTFDPVNGAYRPNRGRFFFATSWQLKEITSKNGIDLAYYSYVRGPFICNMTTFSSKETVNVNNGTSNSAQLGRNGKIISPVYLKSIDFPTKNTRIVFNFSASNDLKFPKEYIYQIPGATSTPVDVERFVDILNVTTGIDFLNESIPPANTISSKLDRLIWAKLNSIEIINSNTNNLTNKFNFIYTNTALERLSLSEIRFLDKEDKTQSSYKFIYSPGTMPDYNKSYNDAAGYYNGSLLPSSVDINYSPNFQVLKASDLNYSQVGILKKIIYPTGGYSSFEYELNDYNKAVSDDKQNIIATSKTQIGGLRIKKISNSHDNVNIIEKEFFYVNGYYNGANVSQLTSSGVINSIPKFDLGIQSFVNYLNGTTGTYSYKSSIPIVPVSNSDVISLGYSEVVEKEGNGGYTIYYITNQDNGHKDLPPLNIVGASRLFFMPSTDMSLERGHIYEQKIFSANNQLIKSISTEYGKLESSLNLYVRSIFSRIQRLHGSTQAEILAGTANKIFYYTYLPTKIIEKQFSGNTYLETKKEFTYNQTYKTIASESITTSKGEVISKYYKYPFDFATLSTYQTMVNKNMVSPIVEQITKNDNLNKELSKIRLDYTAWEGGNKVLPYRWYKSILGNPLEIEKTVNSYDTKDNLLQITEKNGIISSYIWGYNQQHLIAKVNNALQSEVFFDSFEEPNKWDLFLSSLDNVIKRAGASAGMIDKASIGEQVCRSNQWLNISLITPKKFKFSGWIYSNGPSAEIFLLKRKSSDPIGGFSDFERIETNHTGKWVYIEKEVTITPDFVQLNLRIDNNGLNSNGNSINGTVWFDDIRLHPSDAFMTTYTYLPLVGITSETDANNRSIFYEYDAFNRLIIVRDQENNILKRVCYNYAGMVEDCSISTVAKWTSTGLKRCIVDIYGGYNGHEESQERDANPYSNTFNTYRWVYSGYNPSNCPLSACYTCYTNGEAFACINGVCEPGIKVYTQSYWEGNAWVCIYHYEYSDGSWSGEYSEYSGSSCIIE